MPKLLSLEWTKCPAGYEVKVFNPDEFEPEQRGRIRIAVPKAGASEDAKFFAGVNFKRLISEFERKGQLAVLIPKSTESVFYRPLEENPGLFLEFSDLETSPKSAIEFANRYGFMRQPAPSESDLRAPWERGENLADWYDEINAHKHLHKLWDEARISKNFSEFIEFFRRISGFQTAAVVELVMIPALDHPDLRLRLFNLREAIRIQFAQAVSGNLQFRKCAWCPTWFLYGTGTGRRKSAHYCQESCRKAHWLQRDRERKARENADAR